MLYKALRQNPFSGVGMDQGPFPPWYSAIYTNNPNTAGYHPALELCDYWEQTPGNLFQFAHLDISVPETGPALLSQGVLLADSAPGTDTVSSLLVDPVTSQVYGVVLVTGGLVPNAEVGNWLSMEDIGVARQIQSNTDTNLIFSLRDTLPQGLDANALAAGSGPGNGSVITIYRPGHVTANLTPGAPVGVVLNDVLEGSDIVMLIRGTTYILGTNTVAALVGSFGAQSIANGTVSGTSGGATPASQGDAQIVPLESYNSAPVARILATFKAAGL